MIEQLINKIQNVNWKLNETGSFLILDKYTSDEEDIKNLSSFATIPPVRISFTINDVIYSVEFGGNYLGADEPDSLRLFVETYKIKISNLEEFKQTLIEERKEARYRYEILTKRYNLFNNYKWR